MDPLPLSPAQTSAPPGVNGQPGEVLGVQPAPAASPALTGWLKWCAGLGAALATGLMVLSGMQAKVDEGQRQVNQIQRQVDRIESKVDRLIEIGPRIVAPKP